MLNKIVKRFLVVMRYVELLGVGFFLGAMSETGFDMFYVVSIITAVLGFALTFMTIQIEKVEEEEEVEDDE